MKRGRTSYTFIALSIAMSMPLQVMAQWVKMNGPSGPPEVMALAARDTVLFAGMDGDGVFASTDDGTSWRAANAGLPDIHVYSLASSGRDVYAGTYQGVFRTTNDGESWIAVTAGLPLNTPIHAVYAIDSLVLAGADNGSIYRSTDEGTTWARVDSGAQNVFATCFLGRADTLLAGMNGGGLLRSTDRGVNWSTINGVPGVNGFAVTGNYVFAACGGVVRSTDFGATWTTVSSGLSNVVVCSLGACDTSIFAGTIQQGVYRSTDNGGTWQNVASGLFASPYTLCFATIGSSVFAGTVHGAFRTTDNGALWTETNLRTATINVNCFTGWGTHLYAGTEADVYRSTDDGESWNPVSSDALRNSEITAMAALPNGEGGTTLLAGTQGNYIVRSTDDGSSWTLVYSRQAPRSKISQIVVKGAHVYAGTSRDGIIHSTNNGLTWLALGTSPQGLSIYNIFVGDSSFIAAGRGGVFRSTDNCATWSLADLGDANNEVTCMEGHGSDVFVGTMKDGIYYSTDSGLHWAFSRTGPTNGLAWRPIIYSLAVVDGNVYTGTEQGIYVSKDNGAHWVWANYGLEVVGTYGGTCLGAHNGYLYTGTVIRGSWRRPLTEIVGGIADQPAGIPGGLSLSQNFPNPFNPSTVISYSLGATTFVTLKIYDMLGREVTTLVMEKQNAGPHSVSFNAGHLASGVYFYRLQAGRFTATRKLVYLK